MDRRQEFPQRIQPANRLQRPPAAVSGRWSTPPASLQDIVPPWPVKIGSGKSVDTRAAAFSHVATGSSRKASFHRAMRSSNAARRSRIFRACCTNRPAVLMIRKRSRFGRARNNSAGNAMRLSAVSTLCAIAASRSHAEILARHHASGQLVLQHVMHRFDHPRLLQAPLDQPLRCPLPNVAHHGKMLLPISTRPRPARSGSGRLPIGRFGGHNAAQFSANVP